MLQSALVKTSDDGMFHAVNVGSSMGHIFSSSFYFNISYYAFIVKWLLKCHDLLLSFVENYFVLPMLVCIFLNVFLKLGYYYISMPTDAF